MFKNREKNRMAKAEEVRCPCCRYVLDRPHVLLCPRCTAPIPQARGCSGCGQCGKSG